MRDIMRFGHVFKWLSLFFLIKHLIPMILKKPGITNQIQLQICMQNKKINRNHYYLIWSRNIVDYINKPKLRGAIFIHFKKKIPVYVLSGFLGSGKTTVLLNMLEHCKETGLQPGIILNEIGQTNVEGHLFENQKVFELLDGCICCTIQDDLKETMDELIMEMEQCPLDVLFIEGTGVANPLEIQEVLFGDSYIDQFDLMSIITVLDASHYIAYQSIFSSAAEVRKLMHEQMICGSLLVLNKTDLVPANQIEGIRQRIAKKLKQEKMIVECSHGQLDAELLFEKRIHSGSIGKASVDVEHHHHHHHHHSTFQVLKLEDFPVVQKKEFDKWLKHLPANVLRGKGFVEIEGSHQLYSFQYASGKVTFTPVPAALHRKPVMLLIGMGLNTEQLIEQWRQLVAQ